MKEGYYINRDDDTGRTVCVGRVRREGGILYLERWDGAGWVDWPALLDATGIGGAESWFPTSEAEAKREMEKNP